MFVIINLLRNVIGGFMLSTLEKNAVDNFLKLCRREIEKNNVLFIKNRKINLNGRILNAKQALAEIGIFKENEIWKYVLELNVQDCISVGFDYDVSRDYNTEMYIFLKIINGKKVYIKLTYRNKVICLSFHESNYS